MESNFKWLSEGVKPNRRSYKTHYKSFSSNGLTVKLNDFILVRNRESGTPEDVEFCLIAQIKELFEEVNNASEEPKYCAAVHWYSRITDIPRKEQLKLKEIDHQNDEIDYKNELLSTDPQTDIIDAECIFSKCKVQHFHSNLTYKEVNKRKIQPKGDFPWFFCRWRYRKGEKERFQAVLGESKMETGTKKIKLKTPNKAIKKVKMPVEKKPKFGIIKYSDLPRESVLVNGLKISQNDFVLISSARQSQEEIAQIKTLYESVDKDDMKYKAEVEWYTKLHQIPERHRRDLTNVDVDGEIFLDCRNYDSIIDAETISNHCSVTFMSPDIDSSSVYLDQSKNEYFCRYKYSNKKRFEAVRSNQSAEKQESSQSEDDDIVTRQISYALKVKERTRQPRNGEIPNEEDTRKSSRKRTKPSKEIESETISKCLRSPKKEISVPLNKLDRPIIKSYQKTKKVVQKTKLVKKPKEPEFIVPSPKKSRQNVANKKPLPCRESEFDEIYSFIESKLSEETGGCMYISGVPGTGKTATLQAVMNSLKEERDASALPYFKAVEINAMCLTTPHQCYVQILKKLGNQSASADRASKILNERFASPKASDKMVILVVDELDLLMTTRQDVIYNLFDWPNRPASKVVVVAVANTMDLPERVMKTRVSSRLGLTRMTFHPYTHQQLTAIVENKMRGDVHYSKDALQLVARKVAAVSGDARRALELWKRATELAKEAGNEDSTVDLSFVDWALQEMFTAPKIAAIRLASKQEKVLLKAIQSEFSRTGVEETTFARVMSQHRDLCNLENLSIPNMSQLASLCWRLYSLRILLITPGKDDINQKIRMNMTSDDVSYALSQTKVK